MTIKRPRGKEYMTFRAKLLREKNYSCENCGLMTMRLEVHHRKSLYSCKTQEEVTKAAYDRSNCEVLCTGCHVQITAASKARMERERQQRALDATPGARAWHDRVQSMVKEINEEKEAQAHEAIS